MRAFLTAAVAVLLGGCTPNYIAVTRLAGETANPMTDTALSRCSVSCRGECESLDLVELCPLVVFE